MFQNEHQAHDALLCQKKINLNPMPLMTPVACFSIILYLWILYNGEKYDNGHNLRSGIPAPNSKECLIIFFD